MKKDYRKFIHELNTQNSCFKKEGDIVKFKPHEYQQYAMAHILDNPAAGLFL